MWAKNSILKVKTLIHIKNGRKLNKQNERKWNVTITAKCIDYSFNYDYTSFAESKSVLQISPDQLLCGFEAQKSFNSKFKSVNSNPEL